MAALDGINSLATNLGGLNGSISATTSAAVTTAKTEQATTAGTAGAQDQARVSSTGELVAQALNTSDVREDKVASLQAAIASGSYSVSSSDVASKIVDSLLR